MIPFPPYEPDKSIHNPAASSVVVNAKPVADGWGPLPSLNVTTDALTAEPRGAFTARTAAGEVVTMAGTATGMFSLGGSGAWTDVKSGTYALPDGDYWSFGLFGNVILITNSADGLEKFVIGSDSAFSAVAGAPAAKYVMIVGDFVVLLNLASDSASMAWSGVADYTQWTVGEAFADVQAFKEGGAITGGVVVQGGAYIFQEYAIRAMQFAPASGYTFAFQTVNDARGCIAPRSIVAIGPNDFFYLSRDGFFRGPAGQPIGAERVDRTFFSNVDTARLAEVEAAADPLEKVVWVRYPTRSGDYGLLGYDWQLDRWFASDANVVGFGEFANASYTIEELDTLYPGGIDTIPVSIDSFIGGRFQFGAFDRDWKLGYFDGANQQATLETATIEHNPPNRAFVRGAQLAGDLNAVVDGSFDNIETTVDETDIIGDLYFEGAYTMQCGSADYHGTNITWSAAAEPNQNTGIVPFRVSGRLHRYRVIVKSNQTWRHVIGVRPDAVAEGNR